MPRSTNPSNYEEAYWDLLKAMQGGVPEIKITIAASTAQRIKYTFYAFIRALEAQGKRQRSQGNMSAAADLETDANTMRGYLVTMHIGAHEVFRVEPANMSPSTLRFINRDLNPLTVGFREQLKEQLKHIRVPISTEPIAVPRIDSFFAKPLEINDGVEPDGTDADGGVSSNASTN